MYIKKRKRPHVTSRFCFFQFFASSAPSEHHFLHLSSLKLNVHHKLEKDVYIADFELSLR